jgi:hypothetical protein
MTVQDCIDITLLNFIFTTVAMSYYPIAKARGLSRRHLAERSEVQTTAKAVSFVVWILGTHDNRPYQKGHALMVSIAS